MTEFSSAPDDARSTVPATKGMTVGAAASPSHAQFVARAAGRRGSRGLAPFNVTERLLSPYCARWSVWWLRSSPQGLARGSPIF